MPDSASEQKVVKLLGVVCSKMDTKALGVYTPRGSETGGCLLLGGCLVLGGNQLITGGWVSVQK